MDSCVSSGMVTSVTKVIFAQLAEVGKATVLVACGVEEVGVKAGVAVMVGVSVMVGAEAVI